MADKSRNFTEIPLSKYKELQEGGDRLLRLAEVKSWTGLGTTTINKYMKYRDFPKKPTLDHGWSDGWSPKSTPGL